MVHKLLDLENCAKDQVPLVKRFTGGGTVYVDNNSSLVSLIVNKEASPGILFPPQVMKWTSEVYAPVFASGNDKLPKFLLRENDFCLELPDGVCKKFGGNAQAVSRDRWLHHTSFLWDFNEDLLARYLLLPEKRPAYRVNRSHLDFLIKLNSVADIFASHENQTPKQVFERRLLQSLTQRFTLQDVNLSQAEPFLHQKHLRSSTEVDVNGNELADPDLVDFD